MPTAPTRPAAPPKRRARPPGTGSPNARTAASIATRPTGWTTPTTVRTWARREARPPQKSPTPQAAAPARPVGTGSEATALQAPVPVLFAAHADEFHEDVLLLGRDVAFGEEPLGV